ncbi:hypothetical protein HYFRA_00006416 [Hymenoscyphus fraxineus]|uniref:Uncharacterized protein n=1 Tax=Hymenoscyphus fraxineus TaxID=746836 RepID=A0A9N9PFY4_9HELO|nr:hypothetical protein HYFRA_00006416 [Hymenoscyphus fraxineus]
MPFSFPPMSSTTLPTFNNTHQAPEYFTRGSQLIARKKTTTQWLTKTHAYSHPDQVPGFRVAFFPIRNPLPSSRFFNVLQSNPQREICSEYEQNLWMGEQIRVAKERERHGLLDYLVSTSPSSTRSMATFREASEEQVVTPVPFSFPFSFSFPISKKNCEACAYERRAKSEKTLAMLQQNYPNGWRAAPGCPRTRAKFNQRREFIHGNPDTKRLLERRARCEENLKKLAEKYPNGWKVAPGCPEDRPEESTTDEPLVYSKNPFACLFIEDQDEDEEELSTLEPMVYARNRFAVLLMDDDMSGNGQEMEEEEEDRSWVDLSNGDVDVFFRTSREDDEESSDMSSSVNSSVDSRTSSNMMSSVNSNMGSSITEYSASEYSLPSDEHEKDDNRPEHSPTTVEALLEAILPLLENRDNYENSYLGEEEEEEEEEQSSSMSSGTNLGINLDFSRF